MSEKEKTVEEVQKIDLVTILMDFLRAFRRMWIQMVVFAVIGAVLMGVRADRSYRAYYTASATYTVNIREEQQSGNSSSSTYFDNSAAEQMATTFPHIITSGVLQRRVAHDLGITAIPGVITASVVKNTNLLTISVRDIDPERAHRTLEAVIENYPSVSEVIVGKVNLKMLDETGVPTAPDNPKNITSSVVKGGVLGVGVSLCWIVLVALTRKTIRREEDCPRYINLRCLGTIPFVSAKARSKQVEKSLNIMGDGVSTEYKEAIRIIRNKIERSARANSLKTILLTSALAGEGKSTIAVNLAISLAQEGKRVALVDCDLRHPTDNEILQVDVQHGLVDFLKDTARLNECMYNVKISNINETNKFIFVPGGTAIGDGSNLLGSRQMEHVVNTLSDYVDYLILDCAPVGLLTDASVLAQYADGAVFVVRKDYAKASYILSGLEHLAEGNVHMIGCIINGD